MRGDVAGAATGGLGTGFNPRPSHEGRRADNLAHALPRYVSIHAPRMRGDLPGRPQPRRRHGFNPRPSHEGRRCTRPRQWPAGGFNPRPSHEGRLHFRSFLSLSYNVSIHAPRMRGDVSVWTQKSPASRFNPRPSHEGRPLSATSFPAPHEFQSTPLA